MFQKLVYIGVGTLTGLLIILLSNVFVFNLFPFPDDLDWFNNADRNTYIANFPIKGLKSFIFIHMFGVMISSLVTSIIAKHNRVALGIISAVIVFAYVFSDLVSVSYPDWFYYFDVSVCVLSGIIGALIGTRHIT